jgi:hypothetical protein
MRRLLLSTLVVAAAFGAGAPAHAAQTCKELPKAQGMTIGACLPGFVCQDLCYWQDADVYCHRSAAKAEVAVDVCTGVIDKL